MYNNTKDEREKKRNMKEKFNQLKYKSLILAALILVVLGAGAALNTNFKDAQKQAKENQKLIDEVKEYDKNKAKNKKKKKKTEATEDTTNSENNNTTQATETEQSTVPLESQSKWGCYVYSVNDSKYDAWPLDSSDTLPTWFTITGTVCKYDKVSGIYWIQVDSASDNLPAGTYTMTLSGGGMATSAEDCGLSIPNIGDNITVYGTWERTKHYAIVDATSRTVVPTNITINS